MDIFFERIKKIISIFRWNSWADATVCIVVALFFLTTLLGYLSHLRPALSNKKVLRSQIIALKAQLAEKKNSDSHYIFYKEKLKLIKQNFFLHTGNRNQPGKGGNFLALMSDKSLSETLTMYDLRQLPSHEHPVFTVFPVNIFLAGHKKNIIALLAQISSQPHPILLKQFRCLFLPSTEGMSDAKGRLSLLLDFYQDDPAFFSAESQLRSNVFDDRRLQSFAVKPLTNYSLSQLSMQGFLSSDFMGKKFGLIQSPDKTIYKVERGDRVGLEQACVVHMDIEKIVLHGREGKTVTELIIKKQGTLR